MRPFLAAPALIALAVAAAADALSRGQEVTAAFLQGDSDAVWSDMTPDMQAALGSAEALAALLAEVQRGFGTEQAVLSERQRREGGFDVYERIARWTASPAPLQTTVAFDDALRIAGFRVQPQPVAAPSPHLDYQTRTPLRLPFDGAWFVYWGGREVADNYHAADVGQRFASDFVVMQDGQSHAGDPAVLANYHCWDRPILAPADGTVVARIDGLPDQPIGSADPQNPAGNHVVIDFGNGEYGFLAHLQQGSLRVERGERVTAGQEVGRCGNSGNTSEPHLHFHLQTSPKLGTGEGLPAQFYRAGGQVLERGEPARGETVEPAG